MDQSKKFVGSLLDGRYMVKDVIGKGGSACVYRASDVLLNRDVALKILEDDKNELRINTKSFETEVRAIARLSHPNIVNVYDISIEGNIKYIVMEYVEGITLATYLKHKRVLPISEAVSCAKQVLRALREAHEKGIVHRDIKPQNIMIMKNGQIKVADFGIARLPDKDSFRMEDRSIGTVHYISPEQAKGNAVDQRSDLYSLAIVIYETLTGKRPFEAPIPSDVVMMQVTETPARPSEINPEIPPELDSFIMRALSKRPENRYESASDMLRMLERISLSSERRTTVKKALFSFKKKEKAMSSQEREPDIEEEYEHSFEEEQYESMNSGSVERLELDRRVEYEEIDDSDSGIYFNATGDETGEIIEGEAERTSDRSEDGEEFDLDEAEEAIDEAEEATEEAEEAIEETEEAIDEADETAEENEVEKEEIGESVDFKESYDGYAAYGEQWRDGEASDGESSQTAVFENARAENETEMAEKKAKKAKKAKDKQASRVARERKEKSRKEKSVMTDSKKRATIYLASLFAVALVLLISLLIYNQNKLYTVPYYTSESFAEAEGDSVFNISIEREFSSIYPEGAVISQSVSAGEKRKKGTEIVLTVSDGPQLVHFNIPEGADVDFLVSQLKEQISDAGYGITVKTEYEYSGALARGLCFEIDESVYAGGLLKVRVSAGTEKTYVEIPDFTGKSLGEAVEFLNENNVVFEIEYSEQSGSVNTVLSQSVESGKRTEAYVEAGKIILTVGGKGN